MGKSNPYCNQTSGRFGALKIGKDNLINKFEEKPEGDQSWINGGFFVLDPSVIDLIDGDSTSWEKEPLSTLAANNELSAFIHEGFGSLWILCVRKMNLICCGILVKHHGKYGD